MDDEGPVMYRDDDGYPRTTRVKVQIPKRCTETPVSYLSIRVTSRTGKKRVSHLIVFILFFVRCGEGEVRLCNSGGWYKMTRFIRCTRSGFSCRGPVYEIHNRPHRFRVSFPKFISFDDLYSLSTLFVG